MDTSPLKPGFEKVLPEKEFQAFKTFAFAYGHAHQCAGQSKLYHKEMTRNYLDSFENAVVDHADGMLIGELLQMKNRVTTLDLIAFIIKQVRYPLNRWVHFFLFKVHYHLFQVRF